MSFMHDEWLQNKITELEEKQIAIDTTLIRIDGKMTIVDEFYRSTQVNVDRVETLATKTRDRLDEHQKETLNKFSGIIAKNIGASILVGVTIALTATALIYMYIDTKYQSLNDKIDRVENAVEENTQNPNNKFEIFEKILMELQKRGDMENVQP